MSETDAPVADDELETAPKPPRMTGRVTLASAHCLRALWSGSNCTLCFDVCPVSCITFDQRLKIDQKVCIHCGLCASVCPSDAILPSYSTPENLYKNIMRRIDGYKTRTLYLTCSQTDVEGASDWVFTVPCLGDVPSEIWFALCQEHDVRCYLPEGLCLDCPAASGADVMFDRVEAAQRWLGFDIPLEGSWAMLAIPETGHAEEDTRDALVSFIKRIGDASTGKETMAMRLRREKEERLANLGATLAGIDVERNRDERDKHANRLRVGSERRLALNLIGHHPDWAKSIDYTVCITVGTCTGCKSCISSCPMGARIAGLDKDDPQGVQTDLNHCVGCGQCLAVCEQGAIEWRRATGRQVSAGLARTAEQVEKRRVERQEQRRNRQKAAQKRREAQAAGKSPELTDAAYPASGAQTPPEAVGNARASAGTEG